MAPGSSVPCLSAPGPLCGEVAPVGAGCLPLLSPGLPPGGEPEPLPPARVTPPPVLLLNCTLPIRGAWGSGVHAEHLRGQVGFGDGGGGAQAAAPTSCRGLCQRV